MGQAEMKLGEVSSVAWCRFIAMFLLGVGILFVFTFWRVAIPFTEWLFFLLLGGVALGLLGALLGAFLDLRQKQGE
jgi:hypothetical protein